MTCVVKKNLKTRQRVKKRKLARCIFFCFLFSRINYVYQLVCSAAKIKIPNQEEEAVAGPSATRSRANEE
jgi:hypothetical protein